MLCLHLQSHGLTYGLRRWKDKVHRDRMFLISLHILFWNSVKIFSTLNLKSKYYTSYNFNRKPFKIQIFKCYGKKWLFICQITLIFPPVLEIVMQGMRKRRRRRERRRKSGVFVAPEGKSTKSYPHPVNPSCWGALVHFVAQAEGLHSVLHLAVQPW